MIRSEELATLEREIVSCRRCPRLVAWREKVAREKRASFRDEVYWGRPVPGFGDPEAGVVVFGLAPAAHGANRTGLWISAAVRCAPPQNKPTPAERDACLPYAARELELLDARVVVCLGAFAWDAALRLLQVRPKPKFAHGAERKEGSLVLLGCYHPSQQNTFTGVLTPDTVLARALELSRTG